MESIIKLYVYNVITIDNLNPWSSATETLSKFSNQKIISIQMLWDFDINAVNTIFLQNSLLEKLKG